MPEKDLPSFMSPETQQAAQFAAVPHIIELAGGPRPPEQPYVPPVGPGSKSVPPAGNYRDLPPGFIPQPPKK